MTPRLGLVALAGLLGATALTGCGAGSEDAASSATVALHASPAAATSSDVDPAELAATIRDGIDGLSTATMTVSISGGLFAGSASGPVDLTGSTPEMSLTTDGSGLSAMLGGPAELVVADGRGYLRAPILTGRKYADLDDVLRQARPLLEGMGATSGHGSMPGLPKSVGGALRGLDLAGLAEKGVAHASSVERVGPDTIGGVSVDHYVLTFDHDGDEMTVDTWLDDDGVPLRTSAEAPMGTVEVDLADLGAPVDITAPSASQVTSVDLGQLLRGFASLAGQGSQQG